MRIGPFAASSISRHLLGVSLAVAGQTVALAGNAPLNFVFIERLGMTAVLIATPIVGYMLWRRMNTATS